MCNGYYPQGFIANNCTYALNILFLNNRQRRHLVLHFPPLIIVTVLEIAAGHWPFLSNLYIWLAKFTVHFQCDSNQYLQNVLSSKTVDHFPDPYFNHCSNHATTSSTVHGR